MRFQSKYENLVVTYKPKMTEYLRTGQRAGTTPGMRAEFGGNLHIFDSEVAQRRHRWTDEERIELEKFLIDRSAFNSDYTLAFDQLLPDYLEMWAVERDLSIGANFKRRCAKVWSEDDETINQCKNNVVPGTDLCAEHQPKAAQAGMLSTVSHKE